MPAKCRAACTISSAPSMTTPSRKSQSSFIPGRTTTSPSSRTSNPNPANATYNPVLPDGPTNEIVLTTVPAVPLAVGMTVSGPGILPGTTILSHHRSQQQPHRFRQCRRLPYFPQPGPNRSQPIGDEQFHVRPADGYPLYRIYLHQFLVPALYIQLHHRRGAAGGSALRRVRLRGDVGRGRRTPALAPAAACATGRPGHPVLREPADRRGYRAGRTSPVKCATS